MIEWESSDEYCFGYVAMVSDAIPERNLMTFTKGFDILYMIWSYIYKVICFTSNDTKWHILEAGKACTDLRIAEADLGLDFVSLT